MNDHVQPGLHPDADTLSAFAENALPAHERTQTLAHLADCAPCREIVFLAQDAAQQAAPQPAAAPEPFWQRWRISLPIFGLGIGAAALACAGLLFLTLRTHPTAAPTESAHIQPPKSPTPLPPSAAPKSSPPASALKGTGFSPYESASKKKEVALAPEGALKPVPKIEAAPQPMMVGRAFVGAPATGSSSNFISSGSAAGMGVGAAGPRASAVNLGSAAPPPAAPMPAAPPAVAETVTVESAAALGTETPRGNTALADEARVSNTLAAEKKSRQRDAAPASAPTSQMAMLAAPAVRAPLPSNLATTVTVSNGARTLAADTAGALFLSLDSGRHWQPVTPQWNDRIAQLRLAPARNTPTAPPPTLTLDATSSDDSKPAAAAPKLPPAPLEFQLVTAAGTVWTSTDGLTWRPR